MITDIVFLILLLFIAAEAATKGPRVATSYGVLEGYSETTTQGKQVNIFKGVPFAAPPTGELRWQYPEEPNFWTGVRKATTYRAACMSNSSTSSSPQKWVDEDCLYQNIFTPASCMEPNNSCPIMFYMHGGGINYDSAVMFNDSFLVENFGNSGVILVITAYRLGFTGLLTFDDDTIIPRNLPIFDIVQSLKFVQTEISHFGGNPNNVTIFGHSMGATLSIALTLSKTINPYRKLFQRAISMSGSLQFASYEVLRRNTKEFVRRAGCWPDSNLPGRGPDLAKAVSCLKEKDGHDLLAVQRSMEDDSLENRFQGILLMGPLFPNNGVLDFLKNPPKTDLLIGTVTRELDNANDSEGETVLNILEYENPTEILAKYRSDSRHGKLPFNHTLETQGFFISAYFVANALSKTGAKVNLYSFDYPKHPFHTDDLYYIMGVHPFEMDDNERILSKLYPSYFMNFSKFGYPSKEWIPFNRKWDNYLAINVSIEDNIVPRNAPFYQKEVLSYWTKDMAAFDGLVSSMKMRLHEPSARKLEVHQTENTDCGPSDCPSERWHIGAVVVFLMFVSLVASIAAGICSKPRNVEIVLLNR